ncbi:hypothetical protein NQ176_g81 [Zarea fungicola]|uniref:Uncharacterized protein n=1 Tax=Zarea fungicola TaxID=93591 RepID=A0ACC1NZB4_9HYPO|nr:hypothetical protein NQ176_g81 [Lecanicillium fungicola]
MFGGLAIGTFAWVQYQAHQAGAYAIDVFHSTKDAVASTASIFYGSAKGVAERTFQGWENTKEQIELPEWVKSLIQASQQASGGGHSGGGNGGDNDPKHSKVSAVAAIGATATGYGFEGSEDSHVMANDEDTKDDQMMVLTKKMIEIRTILQNVGQSSTLSLPSIVVIGSQSSGKSSVLEAIVGHEFLPKGVNMVTRRPIELTLVNTPGSLEEYGEFPDLGLKHITDFTSIQRTLTDLNLAVPDSDCVSHEPIQLTVYSPNVPDLSLIDLPGYIQVVGQNQPPQLKQKISDLCDKYIQAPNVILAISAADVDLANSTALRASRRVDPRGERTIGVITKMDLVDAGRGAAILNDKQYPLRLGYVGVVSRAPQSQGLFKMGASNLLSTIVKYEKSFFSSHPIEYGPESGLSVGTTTLRRKLMHILEQTMSSSLQNTSDAIRQELEEVTYEFKVQYNDRPLSAESYLAESLDALKHSFKQFTEVFGRPQMHELLKSELDQKLADLPRADEDSIYWRRQLDASSSALTKLGVGRLATTVLASALQGNVESLLDKSSFANHPFARNAIMDAASTILNERFYSTSDQVENCIKPYKFEIDIEEREWAQGRQQVSNTLKKELNDCETALSSLETTVGGRRKLKEVMTFVDKARRGDISVEGDGHSGAGGFSAALLGQGLEAVFLRDRADIIKLRLMAVKSKQCASLKNKYYCPEVFLDAAANRIASTAVLFLNVELLSEFYYNFPRELDLRLGRHLSEADVEKFAKEDPKVRRHLEVIRKKELLELVLEKMESLKQLEGLEREHPASSHKLPRERGRWGLF